MITRLEDSSGAAAEGSGNGREVESEQKEREHSEGGERDGEGGEATVRMKRNGLGRHGRGGGAAAAQREEVAEDGSGSCRNRISAALREFRRRGEEEERGVCSYILTGVNLYWMIINRFFLNFPVRNYSQGVI